MTSQFGFVDGDTLRRRARMLERFDAWQQQHPIQRTPQQALAAMGFLWSLLPKDSRTRPVDVSGIRTMQRMVALLGKTVT